MTCIVPLAGPDLVSKEYGFRPLTLVEGRPLIEAALESRAWRRAGSIGDEDYVFVLRSVLGIGDLVGYLTDRWPGCKTIILSDLTAGALLSVLAGCAFANLAHPIVIDLADILFDGPGDITKAWQAGLGAIVPCFASAEPCYSYLREQDGLVVEAAEKQVISDKASAGVYAFRDPALFLEAVAHSFLHRHDLMFRGSLFVCPSMNGVLAKGLRVDAPLVDNVRPVSSLFHKRAG